MYGTYSPAVAATGYSWIGPYIGGNHGYRWGTLSNSGANVDGIAGGIEGGYNWQLGSFVVGGEADLQASNASGTFASYKFSNPWFGTLRGRGGFAVNNILSTTGPSASPMGAAASILAAPRRTTCTAAGPLAPVSKSA